MLKTMVTVLALTGTTGAWAQKTTIRSPSELPPTRFALSAPPSQAFLQRDFVERTLPLLRAEAERIRATSDMQDQALAQQLRGGLIAIALLQNRPADARALIAETRAASDKPQLKAIGQLINDGLTTGLEAGSTQRCEAAGRRVSELLTANDPALIRDEALARRLQVEVVSPVFLAGGAVAEFDPAAAGNGGRVDLRTGLTLAGWRAAVDLTVPCRATLSDAIRRWVAGPGSATTNIWREREPAVTTFSGAKPVVVAVWDSGIDHSLFAGQLSADPAEPIDGRDNDGNGIVDDWNGPTYDYRTFPSVMPLKPVSKELAPQLAFQMMLDKGNADLLYGYDTPEARLFAQRAREASVGDQAMDAVLWEEVGSRNHGTAVASEIADGAPFIRLFSMSGQPWGDDPRPVVVDETLNDRWIATVDRLPARFRSAGVRVVNMSWGYTVDEIREKLLQYGGVTDEAVATSRAKAMWAKADAAMRRLLAASPQVLFVASAGNSNQTEDILASTPQVVDAPNLIQVGATGTNGRATAFTTYGKRVAIYAWGENVPLRVPGGMATASSGTSMSAPLVTRAAAQMLAVNPRLSPADLIAGLKGTATEGPGGLKLLHAANAVAWAKTR